MEGLSAGDGEDADPVLPALCAPHLDALLLWLERQGHRDALWVDLSSGGWRPRQAAVELTGQLGMALAPCEDSGHGSAFDADEPSYAAIIGSGVDAEARGDRPVITAYRDARAIATQLAKQPLPIMILAPRFGFSWRRENIWLIRFLIRRLQPMGVPLRLAAPEIAEVPPGPWRLRWETLPDPASPAPSTRPLGALIPGLVPPDAAPLLAAFAPATRTLSLANGYRLIAPEQRCDPASLPRNTLDRFTGAARTLPWMYAFGQRFGNNLFVDSLGLTDLAWQAFSQGSNELALELLDRAVTCAKTPVEKAVCHARAQGIRIATQRFSEVAAVPEPSRALPAGLRDFILQTKGWGMVMAGDAARAEDYFSQPLAALRAKPSRDIEDLYLLNIYALARLRQGQTEQALELERQIEAEHDALPRPDHRLAYINGINLARLYRKRGELEQARRYYAKAFATADGARGPSEAIHWNLIQASMHQALGQEPSAQTCWLRAALHWLASEVPEGIGNRVMQALLGRRPEPHEDLVEAASAVLLQRLGGTEPGDPATAPAFVRSDELTPNLIQAGFGAPGWSLLASRQCTEQSPRQGSWRALARRVWQLVEPAGGNCLAAGGELVLVVDDRHGRELAPSPLSLLTTGLEREIPVLCWEGNRLDLTPEQRAHLLGATRLGVGPAVELLQLDDSFAFATFKRYFTPRRLDLAETRLLRAAREGRRYADATMTLDLDAAEARALTRRLLEQRLLRIELTEEACIEVGINWPTSGT